MRALMLSYVILKLTAIFFFLIIQIIKWKRKRFSQFYFKTNLEKHYKKHIEMKATGTLIQAVDYQSHIYFVR